MVAWDGQGAGGNDCYVGRLRIRRLERGGELKAGSEEKAVEGRPLFWTIKLPLRAGKGQVDRIQRCTRPLLGAVSTQAKHCA